jgi:hypothetical protein
VNRDLALLRTRIIYLTALTLFAWSAPVLPALGQGAEPVAMRENFRPGYQYHVSCRVQIKGQLIVPPEQGQTQPTRVDVVGESRIAYDERILAIKDGRIDRTVRYYDEMRFDRQVGKNEQRGTLRDAVRRLVILRHKQLEVPFSPHGPLLWDEIDMVRTDVFTPALDGLLPVGKVRPGDSWVSDVSAVQELTDLESITEGRLTCTFSGVTNFGGRSLAKVGFKGRVKGVDQDGPAEHELDGHLLFDLASQHLSYVTMSGTQHLLGKDGRSSGGRITGELVITRGAAPVTDRLSDANLKGLTLEPNEQNTQLWFISPEIGVSFLYPRHWHVAGVNSDRRQVGLDEKRGTGILMTVDGAANIPQAAAFQKEISANLGKQNMKLVRIEGARALTAGVETFLVEGEAAGKRVYLQYFLIRQNAGGAVLTANLQAADLATARQEVERIARSVVVMAPAKSPGR